jgi:hypothetical protein
METIEIEGYEVRDFFDITDEGTNIEGIVVTSEDGDVTQIEGRTLSDFEDDDENINEDELLEYIEDNI